MGQVAQDRERCDSDCYVHGWTVCRFCWEQKTVAALKQLFHYPAGPGAVGLLVATGQSQNQALTDSAVIRKVNAMNIISYHGYPNRGAQCERHWHFWLLFLLLKKVTRSQSAALRNAFDFILAQSMQK